jgi:predicted lipoprotein with Yx(FWY)xxD motif
MPHPPKSQSPAGPRSRGRFAAVLVAAAIAGSAVIAASGLAAAKPKPKPKPAHPTVTTAHNAGLRQTVLVDSHGLTLYELSPETTHHLLCNTSTCLHFWPALEVSSAKAKLTKGPGVNGKLGTMPRGNSFQITLGDRPLYHFFQDKAKGQAHGNGIPSFGGVWHVVKAGAASTGRGTTTTTTMTGTPTTTTTTTSSTYSYPVY